MAERIRQRMVFTGLVQGVGFRYLARHAAAAAGATGWVRNEPDGSVTMELQGTREQIERVLEDPKEDYTKLLMSAVPRLRRV